MPRFFFHITGGTRIEDDRGTRCETVAQAKEFALAVAAELGRNRTPNEIEHLAVCATDATGREIFRTPVLNLQRTSTADEITKATRPRAD
jgi:Domain of unknown function (DUF6894)